MWTRSREEMFLGAVQLKSARELEEIIAELTDAAYGVALRHGLKGPFLDVELDLWAALREVVSRELFVDSR